ncbi:Tetratricopeptide repeat protein [Stieleria bergensis]|uniref:Tetratricopeptide repeat protein n=2 Tax=Stieleria bergensis TaxID=2528025 RepID=A0A517SSW6_9BACT|nr:Tetratricopeptide repeat protein [Planctomycetes bacterium SV_7m_r]
MQMLTPKNGLVLALCLVVSGCGLLNRGGHREDELFKPLTTNSRLLPQRLPEQYEMCVQTAETVAAKGHANEAIKLYEKAEQLKPKRPPFDLQLAPLYAQISDTPASIARYRSAMQRGHDSADVYNNLAWTLLEAGRLADAQQTIQLGSQAHPGDQRLAATNAVLLYHAQQPGEAFDAFETLYGTAAAHHNLAILDLESDDVEGALEQLALATSSPNCPVQAIEMQNALTAEFNRQRVLTARRQPSKTH